MGATEELLRRRRRLAGGQKLRDQVAEIAERLNGKNVSVIARGTARYPALLEEIPDPPPLLYVQGDVASLARPQLAIVGSRRCSSTGARAARQFAFELVEAGFVICSGLALGIDSAAHRATLEAGGQTVAVMATGIEERYPRSNRTLAEDILSGGALVTEFPPGTPPKREHFPMRNRLISGLSVGVLVVEASLRSGSLITARLALEQNREVFALPHSIFHPGGQGCLSLLRQGAKLTGTVADICDEVGSLCAAVSMACDQPASDQAGKPTSLPGPVEAVYSHIGFEPTSVDELVAAGAGDAAEVVAALQSLELAGLVEQSSGLFMRRV